jgi:hypothetical protein
VGGGQHSPTGVSLRIVEDRELLRAKSAELYLLLQRILNRVSEPLAGVDEAAGKAEAPWRIGQHLTAFDDAHPLLAAA